MALKGTARLNGKRNSGPRGSDEGLGAECWQGWAMDAFDGGDSGSVNGVLGIIFLNESLLSNYSLIGSFYFITLCLMEPRLTLSSADNTLELRILLLPPPEGQDYR